MIYVYIKENDKFREQIRYTFRTIFNIMGMKFRIIDEIINFSNEDIIINYSKKVCTEKNFINIKKGKLFSNKYLLEKSMPSLPLKKYNDIQVIYLGDSENPYVEFAEKSVITNIDIIESIFFLITRYEEVILFDKIKRDKCDRFPYYESLAYKENFINIPIVNEYIEWVLLWIQHINPNYKKNIIWGNSEFAVCLTHDVDRPIKYNYSLIDDFKKLRYIDIENMRDIFYHTLTNIDYKYDPFNTFNYMRKVEKKYNFNSSFYFMSGGETRYDNNYQIDSLYIRNLMKELECDKCEIGYHYSFNSYDNYEMRTFEKKTLEKYVNKNIYGGRNHYLKFRVPESWRVSEKVNLLYDTTLGYNNKIGFRASICMPYRVFDIFENRELNLWEIPLIIMDGALKNGQGTNGFPNNTISEIITHIDMVKKYNGIFTLLWHNSSFDKPLWRESKKIYEKTLEYLYENSAMGLTGIEVIETIKGNQHEEYINN